MTRKLIKTQWPENYPRMKWKRMKNLRTQPLPHSNLHLILFLVGITQFTKVYPGKRSAIQLFLSPRKLMEKGLSGKNENSGLEWRWKNLLLTPRSREQIRKWEVSKVIKNRILGMSTFLSCYDCESPSTKGSFPSSGESKLEIDNEGSEFPGQNHDDLG